MQESAPSTSSLAARNPTRKPGSILEKEWRYVVHERETNPNSNSVSSGRKRGRDRTVSRTHRSLDSLRHALAPRRKPKNATTLGYRMTSPEIEAARRRQCQRCYEGTQNGPWQCTYDREDIGRDSLVCDFCELTQQKCSNDVGRRSRETESRRVSHTILHEAPPPSSSVPSGSRLLLSKSIPSRPRSSRTSSTTSQRDIEKIVTTAVNDALTPVLAALEQTRKALRDLSNPQRPESNVNMTSSSSSAPGPRSMQTPNTGSAGSNRREPIHDVDGSDSDIEFIGISWNPKPRS